MLDHLRVLDLTTGSEQICGQILGQMGADVVLIEGPGGSPNRKVGPFAGGIAEPDRSLDFWAVNRDKRSVIADITTDEGRADVRELAASADFVIESFTPGYLDGIGLGYESLREINERVILVSITPFGQTGPKAKWAANDLTVLASSGALQLTGDEDRAPTRVAVPQAFLHGGSEAAVGALIAHFARERDGVGQHVDISVQAATAIATQSMILANGWGQTEIERLAGGLKAGPLKMKMVNRAKDGFVSITFLFGTAIGPFSRRLMEELFAQGFVDAETRDKDWINYTTLLISGAEPLSELDRCIGCIAEFAAAHTKAELFELALEKGLLIVPVATTEDIVHSEHLAAREYWESVAHPELGLDVTYPGAFAKLTGTPLTTHRRPPLLGEHTTEVRTEWRAGSRTTSATASTGDAAPALAGLKVLDFMWVMAGPAASRYLADYGAAVIRIESATHIDAARTIQPFKDNQPGPERSGIFAALNAGKLGLSLNPSVPAGRDLALRLVEWADVVMESFSPRAMKNWGLDYEALRAVKPDIIMASTCLNGHTGPHAKLAGFGTMGAQLAGFGELAGWVDRPPAGPFGAYTDYVAPKYLAAAVLAAIDHRKRTGEGQYIDVSQAEASLHFLGPAFLDYTVNNHVMSRNGNASNECAPHAVFPCRGDDRWVAIAATTGRQWEALAMALDQPGWISDPHFITMANRIAHHEEIEMLISTWTLPRDVGEVEEILQAAGVPCHRSSRSYDAFEDPQLIHRGHFVTLEHPELGPVPIESSRMRFSRTPASVTRLGPTLGQDTDFVLRSILGLGDEEIVELVAAGALE